MKKLILFLDFDIKAKRFEREPTIAISQTNSNRKCEFIINK